MNYKNWDNRKINRGRGRGNNWNWRGRGYNRMTNPFLQNLSWTNPSQNYGQYHLIHHEAVAHHQNSRLPRLPIPSSNITSVIVSKPTSPLPGSEEYTQNKIQQTSDLIKRQLNIDSETCSASEFSSSLTLSDSSNNNVTRDQEDNTDVNSTTRPSENRRIVKQLNRKNKTSEIIDVQEIHDRIIKHISNLSYSKKMNLVNQSTLGYDIAIHEVQKQKQLELSRALRDISKRQSQSSDDGEVINAIIPDIGIKIEDLPNDVIAELSNSLNLHLEDQITNLVDPEVCFKQAEEILNVNFEGNESNIKMFEHNLRINVIANSTRIHDNMATENIITTDYNQLHKSDREFDSEHNAFQENSDNYEQQSMENMFFDSSDTHNNDQNSEDDYSKDVEFNNFCFENLDVTKSYLTPFTSIKSHQQDFINDDTASNISEKLPKISVRKDILLDTTGSNSNDNLETFKSQSNSNSPMDISHSEESCRKFPTDDSESFNSIIESTNYLHKLQKHSLNEFTHKSNSSLHSKDTGSDSNWKDDSNINENNAVVNDLSVSVKSENNHPSIVENYSEEQHISYDAKDDLKLPNVGQQVENILTPSVQDTQNIDRSLQILEISSQKRWKSPGEKKMMTDVHLKSNVSNDSEQTLNNTILEQMEEFNKKMMTISTESCMDNLRKGSGTSANIMSKPIDENLLDDYFHTTNVLTTLPIQTPECCSNVSYDNDTLNNMELNKTSSHEQLFSKNISQDVVIKEMDHVSSNNQKIQTNDKSSISCSNNTEENVSIMKTEDRLNLDSKQKPYDVAQKIFASSKEDSNIEKQSDSDCLQKHTRDDLKHKEKMSKLKNDTEKQHKYKKSKCKTIHKTINDEVRTPKQKIAEVISLATTVVNDINKNALNMKNDSTKSDKLDSEKLERNEGCRKIKTAAEKKETVPVLKNVQSVYVQTDVENDSKAQNLKLQSKEYRNVEIQTSNMLTSSVQTNTDIEISNSELKHRNYLNSLLKLKGIDDEIEKLMNMKKKIYESMEYEYNMSNVTNCLPIHKVVDFHPENTIQIKHDSGLNDSIYEKNKEASAQREFFSDVVIRKHKKTDSDNDHEESAHSPKRKKRHRNIEKNINNDSSVKSQLSNSNNTNNLKSFNRDEDHCTNVRKPLSIKISLKNITQSSSKPEFQKTEKLPDQVVSQKINAKQDSPINSNNKSTNKQNISVEKQSRKRNSAERKFAIDSREYPKLVSVNKPSDGSDAISNVDMLHKGRIKASRNKKLKISKHNTSDSKLYKYNHGRILNKSCHVVIERFTVEYLESLKRSLQEANNKSPKSHLAEEDKPHSTDLFTSNSVSKTGEVCDLKRTIIENIDVNCDENYMDFKNFTGAILDMQVVEDILLASADSGYLYFFNMNTGDNISSISVSDKPVTSTYVLLNDEHYNIYTGCLNGNLTIIDFNSKQVSDIIQCEEGIQCIEKGWEFLFMGSNRGHVMRYNFKKMKLESSIKIYDTNILAIKAAQEGARRVILVASRNAQITVRDAMSGLLLRTMNSTIYPTVYTILLENNLVYCGTSQHNILIYTFQEGQLSSKYEAVNSKGILCLKIMGNLLFAGCYNGNVYVYNIHASKYIGEITGPGGMLLSMNICGNKIIVGTKSNKLRSLTIPQVYLDQLSS